MPWFSGRSLVQICWLGLVLTGSSKAHAEPGTPPLAEGAVALPEGIRLSAPFPEGVEFRVSCDYAPCNPSHKGTQDPRGVNDHYALDLTVNARGNGLGTEVSAAAAGRVIFAGWGQERMSIYGKNVVISHGEHAGGELISFYAHLAEVIVKEGDWVEIKDPVGRLGGSSRGKVDALAAHLHFSVYQGASLDGGPVGGRSVRPEPMDGYSNIQLRQVMVAGDGLHDALYVIVDDLSEGFELSVPREQLQTHTSASSEYEQWIYGTEDTWTAPTGYGPGATHLSTPVSAQGPPGVQAHWVPSLPQGRYRIQVFVPRMDGVPTEQAAYRVQISDTEVRCPLSQASAQGGWVELCEGRAFKSQGSRDLWVELDNLTGESEPVRLSMDALRFVRVRD